MKRKAALFLDRDGVINYDTKYPFRRRDIRFVPGALEFIASAHKKGWLIFIITNQAGIAKGLYDQADFISLMGWYCKQIEYNGGKINKVFYCPHHEEGEVSKFKIHCDCRKPGPGMFLVAANEYQINLRDSFFIGDRKTDGQAAINAGIKNFMFLDRHQNTRKQFVSAARRLKFLPGSTNIFSARRTTLISAPCLSDSATSPIR